MGSWILAAACTVTEPEMFFPLNSSGSTAASRVQIAAAKAVCHRCPVIESCRDWSLANPRMTEYGIWAGTTEEERRTERRRAWRATQRVTPRQRWQPTRNPGEDGIAS
jgi:WhiB family redox-sensing transcriptional regulator